MTDSLAVHQTAWGALTHPAPTSSKVCRPPPIAKKNVRSAAGPPDGRSAAVGFLTTPGRQTRPEGAPLTPAGPFDAASVPRIGGGNRANPSIPPRPLETLFRSQKTTPTVGDLPRPVPPSHRRRPVAAPRGFLKRATSSFVDSAAGAPATETMRHSASGMKSQGGRT
jgi:hypothetical protein